MSGILPPKVASITASCSPIATYIPDSGVEIELKPTSYGHVASAKVIEDASRRYRSPPPWKCIGARRFDQLTKRGRMIPT